MDNMDNIFIELVTIGENSNYQIKVLPSEIFVDQSFVTQLVLQNSQGNQYDLTDISAKLTLKPKNTVIAEQVIAIANFTDGHLVLDTSIFSVPSFTMNPGFLGNPSGVVFKWIYTDISNNILFQFYQDVTLLSGQFEGDETPSGPSLPPTEVYIPSDETCYDFANIVPESTGEALDLLSCYTNTLLPLPDQVTTQEITDGTETELRSYSPEDIKDFVDTHQTDDQTAAEVSYDNSGTSLISNDVQAAINELDGNDQSLEITVNANTVAINGNSNNIIQIDAEIDIIDADQIVQDSRLTDLESGLGSHPVDSVNAKTGVVVINPDDLDDTSTANKFTTATEISKLSGIEALAEVNQTNGEIKTQYEANSNTNAFTDAEQTKLAGISDTDDQNAGEVPVIATGFSGNLSAADTDVQKALDTLDTISSGAVDSVNTKVGVVVINPDDLDDSATTNKFTTAAEISKLSVIESGATADQSDGEIKTAYENNADTNAFTNSDESKLDTIEAGATADQIASEVVYNNTTSGLTATEVQSALDEIDNTVDSLVTDTHTHSNKIVLDATTASFLIADESKLDTIEAGAEVNVVDSVFGRTGTIVAVTDDYTGSEVTNVPSGNLVATDTQGALNELQSDIDSLETDTHTHSNKIVLDATTASFLIADESKLDSIETGATADQIASEVVYNNTTSGLTATDVQAALDEIDNTVDILVTGLRWIEAVLIQTADDLSARSGAGDNVFSDNDGTAPTLLVGDRISSTFDNTIYIVSAVAWTTAPILFDGDTFFVENNYLDPINQEKGAAYSYDGAALVKVADFDFELADSINLTGGWTEQNATVIASDTIEVAIEKLAGNQLDLTTLTGVSQGSTDLGIFTGAVISDNTDIVTALQELETSAETVESLADTLTNGNATGGSNIIITSGDEITNLVADGLTYPIVDGTNGQHMVTDGSGTLIFEDTLHSKYIPIAINTNVPAVGEKYLVDVSSGPITLTLNATPESGSVVSISVGEGDSSVNNIIIDGNGNLIEEDAGNFIIDVNVGSVDLIFDGNWQLGKFSGPVAVTIPNENSGVYTLLDEVDFGTDPASYYEFVTGIDSTYDEYLFVMKDIGQVAASRITALLTEDGGLTYITTGDYTLSLYDSFTSNDPRGQVSTVGTELSFLRNTQVNTTGFMFNGEVTMFSPANANVYTTVSGFNWSPIANNHEVKTHHSGTLKNLSVVDGIKIQSDSSSFDEGTIKLYGINRQATALVIAGGGRLSLLQTYTISGLASTIEIDISNLPEHDFYEINISLEYNTSSGAPELHLRYFDSADTEITTDYTHSSENAYQTSIRLDAGFSSNFREKRYYNIIATNIRSTSNPGKTIKLECLMGYSDIDTASALNDGPSVGQINAGTRIIDTGDGRINKLKLFNGGTGAFTIGDGYIKIYGVN